MVDQLNAFASEVTRVAREVGTEGKLGGQAEVPGVGGTWKDLTDNVNFDGVEPDRAGAQHRRGDHRGRPRRPVEEDHRRRQGRDPAAQEHHQHDGRSAQLLRLRGHARRPRGRHRRQARRPGARCEGVGGTWKDLTDNVNSMAVQPDGAGAQHRRRHDRRRPRATSRRRSPSTCRRDPRAQEHHQHDGRSAALLRRRGDPRRARGRHRGQARRSGGRARRRRHLEGPHRQRQLHGRQPDRRRCATSPTSPPPSPTATSRRRSPSTSRARSSSSRTPSTRWSISSTPSPPRSPASRARSAPRASSAARRRSRASPAPGRTSPTTSTRWPTNLTNQVRGIAKVVTAVANGDLKRKLALEARGEIAELAETINSMTDTLATFADQVTTVAREVGVEGKLGGQAKVPGAAGTWRDLTDNVNQLAGNLTTQVRAIGDVATAVTKGDLTRSITVEASGEVAALKDNINEMIRNLQGHHAEDHRAGLAEDQPRPLHPHAAGSARPGHRRAADPLRAGAAGARAARRLLHRREGSGDATPTTLQASGQLRLQGAQATSPPRFKLGEGLVGQCAFEKRKILLRRRARRTTCRSTPASARRRR